MQGLGFPSSKLRTEAQTFAKYVYLPIHLFIYFYSCIYFYTSYIRSLTHACIDGQSNREDLMPSLGARD